MNIDMLKVFCSVVEQQSFSLGAAMHHISQSAATQAVRWFAKNAPMPCFGGAPSAAGVSGMRVVATAPVSAALASRRVIGWVGGCTGCCWVMATVGSPTGTAVVGSSQLGTGFDGSLALPGAPVGRSRGSVTSQ